MSSTQSFETENRFSLNEEALAESHSANRIGDLEIHGDGLKQLANSNPSAPVYIVNNGISVQFSLIHIYDYINIRSDFAWKLADDGTSKVDKYDWKNKIGVGGILVQTSFDNENWDTVYTNTNVFADYQPAIKNFYSANRSDLSAGCYYKVIIAYKLSKKTEQKHFLFIDTSNWRNTWNIDEYSFFLISDDSSVTAADIDYTPIDMPDQTKVGDVGIDFSNATVSNRIAGEESFYNNPSGGHGNAAEAANIQAAAGKGILNGDEVMHTGNDIDPETGRIRKNGSDYVITSKDGICKWPLTAASRVAIPDQSRP